MIARVLAKFRLPPRPAGATRPAAPARSRRRSARAAVWSGVAAFLGLTAAMAAALDTARPEWRDPEFGLRLRQVRRWQEHAPHRPLVVAFGSSRTQMGLSPTAMGFPDEPGSPLVYNFGYRAGRPLGAWLHFTRMMDAGVKPRAVLLQLAPAELMVKGAAERQYAVWAPRFSRGDIRRLAPFTDDPAVFHRTWNATHLNPWSAYRQAILSRFLPDWQTDRQRADFEWERMDGYGFSPIPGEAIPAARRLASQEVVRRSHAPSLRAFSGSPTAERVYREWVGRCRAEGIAVAFFWAPESPAYRSWYTPTSRAAAAEYGRRLAAEFGVPVFPAPDHLTDEDFADGDHLLHGGAAKYSRWLADNHLRPWLASQGLAK